ncbi:hypothetical protein PTTG_28301 [Puccinia triticina 1-1 BBBD Race 1]|uniref:Uncharacterized protein n=2 Tax=Puccinia triticina TaxID=208348 RepID=A0A180GCS6_PUCT1|nr:uncharacterized protein PtA15_1A37 [Puccinia triticina]OAV90495.1 hypothetical protein PTTG_28301 [Puccinia triticina 1-1 BBBD Race 1]WAQ80699.1 hypothetical protein PtA15_1A37 [Puccinia triticina]WAR51590.1 hypothetical protein PtB15_1B26 [Puccinia triticina]
MIEELYVRDGMQDGRRIRIDESSLFGVEIHRSGTAVDEDAIMSLSVSVIDHCPLAVASIISMTTPTSFPLLGHALL